MANIMYFIQWITTPYDQDGYALYRYISMCIKIAYIQSYSDILSWFDWSCKIQVYYDEYPVKLMQQHQLSHSKSFKIKPHIQINKIHLNDNQLIHPWKAILDDIIGNGGPHSLKGTTLWLHHVTTSKISQSSWKSGTRVKIHSVLTELKNASNNQQNLFFQDYHQTRTLY